MKSAAAARRAPFVVVRPIALTLAMPLPESSAGFDSAASWKTYSVRRKDKARLLDFIADALRMRGCEIVHPGDPSRAPFFIVFETPAGERHGVLAYAFNANSKETKHRPKDEHRFQIKYGSELKGILEITVDPHLLITTIFLGIDLDRGVFIAADPLMNNPSPMSRSIEFKAWHVEEILKGSWYAWERERNAPKTKDRPGFELDEDTRTEVLIGGQQARLLDLVRLERLARGLDPGERHLVADKLSVPAATKGVPAGSHKLLTELNIPSEALFDLIDGASRLKMAVRGWVAETHLVENLRQVPGVSDCERLEGDGKPDISLRWKGGAPLLIECKNVLRTQTASNLPKVDFQRTRAAKGDHCSRYYRPADFHVLAACLHAVTEEWQFSFALTSDLPPHAKCEGRIASNIIVSAPAFSNQAAIVFDKCSTVA